MQDARKSSTAMRHAKVRTRGAILVEAVVVISLMVMFFLGMVYFRALYVQKLRVQRLARSATVAFAMNACQGGDAIAPVRSDLGNATDHGSGSQAGDTKNAINAGSAPPSVGQNGGNPIGNALAKSGFAGDPIATVVLQARGSGTSQSQSGQTLGYQSTVSSTSYIGCGDRQRDGDFNEALSFVTSEFNFKN